MKEIPSELNWVEVHATCSIQKIYEVLKSEVRKDIDERNKYCPPQYKFDLVGTNGSFTVVSTGSVGIHAVVFYLKETSIHVKDSNTEKPIFESIGVVSY